jgi:DNA-binding phage protein
MTDVEKITGDWLVEYGAFIAEACYRSGSTVGKAAGKAGLAASTGYEACYRNGNPKIKTLEKIAAAAGYKLAPPRFIKLGEGDADAS